MVANDRKQIYADSWLFWQDGDVFLLKEPPI